MLSINISELIWTIINFFLLLFLLRHFLYKPICDFMDARQARIDAGLAKEREAQDALSAQQQRQSEEQDQAREQARVLLRQAETEAAEESSQALRAAKQSAREAERLARQQLQEQSRQEGDRLTGAEPALAELLARRLVDGEGDGQ